MVSRRGGGKGGIEEDDGGDKRKRGEYEESRAQRIKENLERMKSLGIADLSKQLKPPPASSAVVRKPKPKYALPPRRSSRFISDFPYHLLLLCLLLLSPSFLIWSNVLVVTGWKSCRKWLTRRRNLPQMSRRRRRRRWKSELNQVRILRFTLKNIRSCWVTLRLFGLSWLMDMTKMDYAYTILLKARVATNAGCLI